MIVARFLADPIGPGIFVTGPLWSAYTRNRPMTRITKVQIEQLLANGRAQRAAMDQGENALDFKPVVKLFTPDAQSTWLLTELDPDGGLAFGLCDLGLGGRGLGYISLTQLRTRCA